MCDVYEEVSFSKKIKIKKTSPMGQTWLCHFKSESKLHHVSTPYIDSSVRKKFQAQQSIKKVMLTIC